MSTYFAISWTVAHQAPLSMGFPRQEYWSGKKKRILEWVVICFSRGWSQLRDQTYISCIGRWLLYHWATGEVQALDYGYYKLSAFSKSTKLTCFLIIKLLHWLQQHNQKLLVFLYPVTMEKQPCVVPWWESSKHTKDRDGDMDELL